MTLVALPRKKFTAVSLLTETAPRAQHDLRSQRWSGTMNDQVSQLHETALDQVTGGFFGSLFARFRVQQAAQSGSILSGALGGALNAYGEALNSLARK